MKSHKYLQFLIFAILFLYNTTLNATLKVPSFFSDNMLLQRDVNVPVWGWANKGAAIQIVFNKKTYKAITKEDGKWEINLDATNAGGPYTMSIKGDGSVITIKNILMGEIWFCSGQSNMAMTMTEVTNAKDEMSSANYPQIRMFRGQESPAEEPRENMTGEWRSCNPNTISSFSATAYYFARSLHLDLNVPIGIIVSAWGGSSVASWLSRDALNQPGIEGNIPRDVIGWRVNVRPGLLNNAMLQPFVPFTVKGIIWYQGESDAEANQNPFLYRYTFPALILDWRKAWKNPELPFYWVQLPNLLRQERWPILRESQQHALSLPNTGMITTIDIGQEKMLHPGNKKEFGERLANLVLAKTYKQNIPVEYPEYKSHIIENRCVRIQIQHSRSGLYTKDSLAIKGFTIAGADKVFRPAIAKLEGNCIVVSTKDGIEPQSVRYAWEGNPSVNLVNSDGLPLRPFRTDKWLVAGEEQICRTIPTQKNLSQRFSANEIIQGKSEQWKWDGEGVTTDLVEKLRFVKGYDKGKAQLLVMDRILPNVASTSPRFAWKTSSDSPLAKAELTSGCTVELSAQLFQTSLPFNSIELQLRIPFKDKKLLQYRISIVPMRVYGFNVKETRLLGYNLNNVDNFHQYRIAVRTDGTAQVYMDSKLLGILPGEILENPLEEVASLVWGKLTQGGDLTANLEYISYEHRGAFQPE